MADRNRTVWTLVGLAAGTAVGIWLWRRGGERATERPEWAGGDATARIRDALARDPGLAGRALRVEQISDGVVEVAGVVRDRSQRERAVAVAHNAPGVHTVVNRLMLETEEARLQENRSRNATNGSAIQHDGMGVGMGTRRQSPETDPDRPSDRQKLVERELDVDRLEEDLTAPEPGSRPEPEEATSAREEEPGSEAGGEPGVEPER